MRVRRAWSKPRRWVPMDPKWTFSDNIPQVNQPLLAYSSTMAAVGLLGMPRTGAQQTAHVILGQPPSTTLLDPPGAEMANLIGGDEP
jgi:hypothetical protein